MKNCYYDVECNVDMYLDLYTAKTTEEWLLCYETDLSC